MRFIEQGLLLFEVAEAPSAIGRSLWRKLKLWRRSVHRYVAQADCKGGEIAPDMAKIAEINEI